MITYISILITGFLLATLSIGLGFWARCIMEEEKAMTPIRQELFYFLLEREIETETDVIISSMVVEIGTDDPFRTAAVINALFEDSGFYVESFISGTDYEFADEFGEFDEGSEDA